MKSLTNLFKLHRKATIGAIVMIGLVLTTGITLGCRSYLQNQAKTQQARIEKQRKNQSQLQADSRVARIQSEQKLVDSASTQSTQPTLVSKPVLAPTKKTEPTPTKKYELNPYEVVSVTVTGSISGSSATVSAIVGSNKAGACKYTFYQKSPTAKEVSSQTVSTSGGSCPLVSFPTTGQPSGTYKIYVDYKASGYSAKGSGYFMFNL